MLLAAPSSQQLGKAICRRCGFLFVVHFHCFVFIAIIYNQLYYTTLIVHLVRLHCTEVIKGSRPEGYMSPSTTK